MMTKTLANVAVMAALGLLVPLQANAFGLGKLELSSALNEPFKAEIAITALQGDDADNLQVRLASAKEFEQAGIERIFLLTQLKFDVVAKQGQMKIVISSEQPIREPFIDFLLTATTTSSGRLIREYTVLLDPPKSIFQKEATPTPSQNPTRVMANTNAATTNNTAGNYQPSAFSSDSYGPVRRSDTLWDIALKTRPESNVTVHQMMMALLKANPDAFQNNNVNGLKAGYTLKIPNKNDIYTLTKQQASDAFASQNALWKNRNARPKVEVETSKQAEVAVAPKATETPAVDNAVTTEITKSTETTTEADDTARLKLVVPKEQSALNDEDLSPLGAEKIKTLSEQLSLAQETIEGQTQENIDFKSRMDSLEIQMETMRRLISLKDADLARLQSMLETDQQADVNTLVADAANVENPDEAIQSDEAPQSEPLEAGNNAADGELDSLMVMAQKFVTNNKTEVALGAGSLLLLLVLLLIAKRRKDNDDAEEWNDPQDPDNHDDKRALAEDKLEKAITIAEIPQAVAIAELDKKTVAELIDQADKLVAFGDYAKAMTALEQAKQQEPTNQLVLKKLLYVMYKQQLKAPFVALAGSLNINKDSAEWLEIAGWGRELAPLNTLFHDDIASEPEIILDMDAFNTFKSDEVSADTDLDKELEETEDRLSNSIEFNLDDYVKDEAVAPISSLDKSDDDVLSLDTSFNLNETIDFDTPLNYDVEINENVLLRDDDEPLSLSLTDDELQSEMLSIDDDIALDNDQDLVTELNLQIEDDHRDDSNFDFDISGYDEIDEAETKLDLASAYADMGDPDGARNILEEVLKEGNDEQKARAGALLKELS